MATSKPGKPVSTNAPIAPIAVVAAGKAASGALTTAPAAGKDKAKGKAVPPKKVGLYAPPPVVKNKPVPDSPPPEKKSDKPCGVSEVLVQDGDKRKASKAHILQVVPKPAGKEKLKQSWMQMVELERSKGGTEKIEVEVKPKDPKTVDRKQACMLRTGTVAEDAWKNGAKQTFDIKAHKDTSLWPRWVEPEYYYVFGRGCDDAYSRYQIEVFPSQSYKVKIDVRELQEFFQALSGGFSGLLEHWVKTPDKMSKDELKSAEDDQDFEEGRKNEFKDDFEEGKKTKKENYNVGIELSWGWVENKDAKKPDEDWLVCYEVQLQASCDPLWKFGWKPKISFANMAYMAMGCPPGLSKIIAEHVFDVYIQFELGCALKIVGNLKHRTFTYGENQISGGVKTGGVGSFGVVLGAKLGSRWFVAFVVEGAARSEISVMIGVEIDAEGIALKPEVEIAPLTISVSAKMVAFRRTAYSAERSWELGGPWTIYPRPTSKEIKWPPEKAKAAVP